MGEPIPLINLFMAVCVIVCVCVINENIHFLFEATQQPYIHIIYTQTNIIHTHTNIIHMYTHTHVMGSVSLENPD